MVVVCVWCYLLPCGVRVLLGCLFDWVDVCCMVTCLYCRIDRFYLFCGLVLVSLVSVVCSLCLVLFVLVVCYCCFFCFILLDAVGLFNSVVFDRLKCVINCYIILT